MATTQRARDRGRQAGLEAMARLCREIRLARRSRGLSLEAVGTELGMSKSQLSRIERGLVADVSLVTLTTVAALVGLDVSVRAFPGARPLRDARHARLLGTLQRRLHDRLVWRTEVPLPIRGDQRAWDATISGQGWRYGVEAEMNPSDGQAILRRLQLKHRDGSVDGVILLMPETRQSRLFRAEFAPLLAAHFPVTARRALAALAVGDHPGGSSIVVL